MLARRRLVRGERRGFLLIWGRKAAGVGGRGDGGGGGGLYLACGGGLLELPRLDAWRRALVHAPTAFI